MKVTQIGAVVMVNHNVNDQIISQPSRFISINNNSCLNLYPFEHIKHMCRNATLSTTITFLKYTNNSNINIPQPRPMIASISALNKVKTKKQNKQRLPRISTENQIEKNELKKNQKKNGNQKNKQKRNKNGLFYDRYIIRNIWKYGMLFFLYMLYHKYYINTTQASNFGSKDLWD